MTVTIEDEVKVRIKELDDRIKILEHNVGAIAASEQTRWSKLVETIADRVLHELTVDGILKLVFESDRWLHIEQSFNRRTWWTTLKSVRDRVTILEEKVLPPEYRPGIGGYCPHCGRGGHVE